MTLTSYEIERYGWGLLLGATVREVWLDSSAQEFIKLVTDRGDVWLVAEGDCCSQSWFYHVTGLQALIGQTVNDVDELEMPDAPEDGLCRQEVDALYGVALKTGAGVCTLEFRNSSNGYYGGWLYVSQGPWGRYGRNKDDPDEVAKIEATLRQLTGDYCP